GHDVSGGDHGSSGPEVIGEGGVKDTSAGPVEPPPEARSPSKDAQERYKELVDLRKDIKQAETKLEGLEESHAKNSDTLDRLSEEKAAWEEKHPDRPFPKEKGLQ